MISGNTKHCQTFEIEVETIVEEEICHNITTLVCQEPLIRSGEEAETTTKAADTKSMDTTTVTNSQAGLKYVPTLDGSLIRSVEEADATTTAPAADAESMDATTVSNPQAGFKNTIGRKTDISETGDNSNLFGRSMGHIGRSIGDQGQVYPHGCVNKVSEVCYPSQRVEKVTEPKEFCWVSQ